MPTMDEDRDRAALSRRPDAHSWSTTEILCHLRDVEELFTLGATPEALAAWGIGGAVGHPLHQARGRMAAGEWVASLAGHGDNQLAQLRRTLDGRP